MGKPKYIETPEKLWDYFQEYKKETKRKRKTTHNRRTRMLVI
jgi:hypothetical protein